MSEILKRDSALLPQDKPYIETPGGGAFVNPNYTFASSLAEGRRLTEVRKTILEPVRPRSEESSRALVGKIRSQMIDEIKKSSAGGVLTNEQKLMIKRIEKINVVFSDCSHVEARNSNTIYTIQLCSNVNKMPRLALASLIAHEMAHSIDLCSLGRKFLKKTVAETRFDKIWKEKFGQAENDLAIRLKAISSPDSIYLLDNSFREPSVYSNFSSLIQSGHLQVVDSGVALNLNPALSTYKCLANQVTGYARVPTSEDMACENTSYTESSAQIWAARIVANYVNENPPSSRLEALGLFANSTNISFGPGRKSDLANNKEADMNNIYLSEPSLQKLFNCQPEPKQNCMQNFNVQNSTLNVVSPSNARPASSPNTNRAVEVGQ